MTGFARAEASDGTKRCTVELRTVNNRFIELNVRMPSKDLETERKIKQLFSKRLTRGYVEITVTVSDGNGTKRKLSLDEEIVGQFLQAAAILREKYGVAGEPDMASILSLKDIFKYEEEEADGEERWKLIETAVNSAIQSLVTMREAEGGALETDIMEKLAAIETSAANILVARKKQETDIVRKLKERLEELTAGMETDPQRVLMEAGILAERSDISEEITRLHCHIKQLKELMEAGNAIGRKVEFIVQEMNREVNTIGSKSALFDISREVVEIKSNLEKIREQSANIE
jgi:uncharacterized protein (TIGR00255 family)